MKDIDLGDIKQEDIERVFTEMMVAKATSDIMYAVENEFGTSTIKTSEGVYTIDWEYVGLDNDEYMEFPNKSTGEIDYIPVGNWYWEYDGPDFEVSSLVKMK